MRCQLFFTFAAIFLLGSAATAQVDDICREFGYTPTLDFQLLKTPYVFGRVIVKGVEPNAKFPSVTINFIDPQQANRRIAVDRRGNYCFRRSSLGGTLIVEVEGTETARRVVSSVGPAHHREDFELEVRQAQALPPSVISAKFYRPPNDRTVPLYRAAAEAETAGRIDDAIAAVKEIVGTDRDDFVAWSKLGSLYLGRGALREAENAFRRALEVRGDYTPALVNLGTVAAIQKYYPAAIVLFQEAIKTDPSSARIYRLLGEAYLQNKQGTLGLAALDKALELDPQGMAECHLLKARLYDLAGAKHLATAEYRAFLTKVPDYPDKAKLEQYIKDNPARPGG
ncbi:MAG: tetratricopeptide repeat protein [Chloracidobacterium sp.]|nr:tetratricopeptide repeat protein [Chloracidobacterium sp.]